MITRIEIDGFKSFRNFQMEFSPLTVIAGANASGKSNLFDALHLLSHLAEMDLKTAFSRLRGEPIEQFTYYGDGEYAEEMSFVIDLLVDQQVKDNWDSKATLTYTRLRYSVKIRRLVDTQDLTIANEWLEKIRPVMDTWSQHYLSAEVQKALIPSENPDYHLKLNTIEDLKNVSGARIQDGVFSTPGLIADASKRVRQTYLSSFNRADTPHFLAAREEMRNWQFPTLSPKALSQPSPYYTKDKALLSGENLAAVLHRIKADDSFSFRAIARKLTSLVPSLTDLDVIDDKANQQYVIQVKSQNKRQFSSRVMSAGTLRLLALCVLSYDEVHKGVVAFEEPENGIHPFRIKDILSLLSELSTDFTDTTIPLRQVLINTHSPTLVSETFTLDRSQAATVWLAQLVTQVTTIRNKRVSLLITKILPIGASQTTVNYSETETKLTVAQAVKYLESAVAEGAIETLTHSNE